jgi:hypothetical protein
MRCLLRIGATIGVGLLLQSCIGERGQPGAFTPALRDSFASPRTPPKTYGVGYVSFPDIGASSNFRHKWCLPANCGSFAYGILSAKSNESRSVGGSGAYAKFANEVISGIGNATLSTSLATRGGGTGTSFLQAQYADIFKVESKTLKPGATVNLLESLEVQPQKIAVGCKYGSGQTGSLLATITFGPSADIITVGGACRSEKFVWWINGNYGDRGKKVSRYEPATVGASSFFASLVTNMVSDVKGNLKLSASICYTLTSVTKGATVVAKSGHDYSKC